MERKWWTLIAVCVAIFMLLLDITVVNVALPRSSAPCMPPLPIFNGWSTHTH